MWAIGFARQAVAALTALALGAPVAARQTGGEPPVVRVAAAADLQYALEAVAARLATRRPAVRIEAIYGSSGSMHAQLRQRAPYDVYLSADLSYPRDLVSNGVGSARDLFSYATGRLVVWVPPRSTLALERDGMRGLERAARIAIANPRHAPYGRAAEAALRQVGIWDLVKGRLVLGENVAQAAQFVQSGAADAAIIARSLAVAPPLRGGRILEIPADMHPPLEQGGLILPWARSRAAAEQLRDFLLGPEGRELLAALGFEPPVP